MTINKEITQIIFIIGGKWFDKRDGNTYHNTKMIILNRNNINDNLTFYSGYAYGYGKCYITSAEEYLKNELGIKYYKLIDGGSYYMNKRELNGLHYNE